MLKCNFKTPQAVRSVITVSPETNYKLVAGAWTFKPTV